MPCRFKFSYKNNGNLIAFVSCIHTEPTFSNSEKKSMGRPKGITISNTDQRHSKGASRTEMN
jgi:hypothetical protein